MIGLLIQQRPENTVFLFSQGYLSMEAGAALAVLGQHERGIEFLRRGLQSFEAIGAKDQANRWARTNVAQAHRVIADNLLKLNRHDEARQGYLLSVSMLEELVRQDPQNRTIQSYLEQARKALASLPLGQR
jgi:tetratricopeptide (TPR) repeat protein